MTSRDEVIAAHRARYEEQAQRVRFALSRAGIQFPDDDVWPAAIANAIRLLQTRSMQRSGYDLLDKMGSTLQLHYYIESPTVVYVARLPLDSSNYRQGIRMEALR